MLDPEGQLERRQRLLLHRGFLCAELKEEEGGFRGVKGSIVLKNLILQGSLISLKERKKRLLPRPRKGEEEVFDKGERTSKLCECGKGRTYARIIDLSSSREGKKRDSIVERKGRELSWKEGERRKEGGTHVAPRAYGRGCPMPGKGDLYHSGGEGEWLGGGDDGRAHSTGGDYFDRGE